MPRAKEIHAICAIQLRILHGGPAGAGDWIPKKCRANVLVERGELGVAWHCAPAPIKDLAGGQQVRMYSDILEIELRFPLSDHNRIRRHLR